MNAGGRALPCRTLKCRPVLHCILEPGFTMMGRRDALPFTPPHLLTKACCGKSPQARTIVSMCTRKLSLLLLFLLSLTVALAGCKSGDPQVVCVDVEKIMTDSKAAREANEHLAKVQAILQKGLEVYQEELKKSPESQRQQELQQGLALLRRQLVLEQAAARNVVHKHMLAQIEAWRADKGNTVVIARQSLLSAPATVDITADIQTRMDAGSVEFAELPKVSIRTRPDADENKDAAEDSKSSDKKDKAADKKESAKK